MMRTLMVTTLVGSLALTGCTTNPQTGQRQLSKTVIGGLLGAGAGAAVAKSNADKDKMGRAAAIGAVLGGGIGLYMDNQERKLREQLQGSGVSVERNQQTGAVDLVMPGNITFATNSAQIAPPFQGTLNQLAQTLNEFNKSSITVKGYTDNVGAVGYNQQLSQDRANSVANYLIRQSVSPNRIQAVGYGMSSPVASNTSEEGRSQNRRVEISVNPPASL